MKIRNIVWSLLCGGVLGFSSCESFLEETPLSDLNRNIYYENEAQAIENINSMYRRGAPVRYGVAPSAYIGPTASINTMLTGYFTNSYEGQELITQYARLLTRQQNTRIVSNTMNTIWNESYQAINIANGAIKYIPTIDMDEERRAVLVAEAKFFRAFNYFYLVKTFGPLPLSTEPYENLENLYLERQGINEVYALIEADLQEAVDVLPATAFLDNGRRITKFVAAMALANVYLQQEKYEQAATYAKIVTNSPHSLTTNTDLAENSAYNKLRTQDNLPETIYSYEFDETISNSSWWPTYAFSSTATSVFDTYSIFERIYGPTDRFLNVYTPNDLRIKPNQFYHWEYTNPDNGKTWTSTTAGVWYFYDETALLSTGRGTKDWNIYRYAEALLIAAEALVKSTGSVNAEAAGYLAQIKARADVTGKSIASYTTELQALSAQKFVEECWTERLRELPLEFKMWDDCLRTKKFPVISATQKGVVTYQNLVGASNASGAVFKQTDLVWPISMDELQRNTKLTQNEGY
ncbi:RagB/SusD family nutrient uptake outer membrane protein [Sphingobacterium suaedae]|uniref:RagB/SusD family nutrient uptake outer membrane protein n=1 Tax=Sphingobacterium suaedae TaxID=1686402 RepID=A0ABW5KND1_9SPHI